MTACQRVALEFTILTAVRTSEAIGATWNEIDMDAGVWTIPASQDEGQARPSRAVVGSSRRDSAGYAARKGQRDMDFVFINGGGLPLSNMAMSELLKGMVPPERATVHGFRSTLQRLGKRLHRLSARRDRAMLGARHQGQVRSCISARGCDRQAPQAHGRLVEVLCSACDGECWRPSTRSARRV